jgi:N-acetylmuramoyl-L-alanine amidase
MTQARDEKPRTVEAFILGEHTLMLAFIALCIFGTFVAYLYFGRTLIAAVIQPAPTRAFVAADEVAGGLTATVLQRHRNSAGPTRIGLVAGHLGYDSGAVCDDGLQEVTINYNVAVQVAAILQANGLSVELLNEEDGRLTQDYRATAVVSLHSDSCQGAAATLSGYKSAASQVPNSDILQTCINERYAIQTGLRYNENTITNHMTEYYVFGRLSPTVPALILEMGFMGGDRDLLTNRTQLVAAAVADGIMCFVERVQ